MLSIGTLKIFNYF